MILIMYDYRKKGDFMKPALVILAAGIGNRYGGAKQITPVGPCGEKIMDFPIFFKFPEIRFQLYSYLNIFLQAFICFILFSFNIFTII